MATAQDADGQSRVGGMPAFRLGAPARPGPLASGDPATGTIAHRNAAAATGSERTVVARARVPLACTATPSLRRSTSTDPSWSVR